MSHTARRKNGFSAREIHLGGSGGRSTTMRVAGKLAGEVGAIFNFDDECADFFRRIGFKGRKYADIQHSFGAIGRGFGGGSGRRQDGRYRGQGQKEEMMR